MINFIKKVLSLEIVKFLIVGGINTLMGGILIPYLVRLFLQGEPRFYGIDISLTVGYLIWFTFAYLLQVKYVFNTNFNIKRYLLYPLTQIPNYLINQGFLYLFEKVLKLSSLISLFLAAILAVPIMFIIVRLVVKDKHERV
ncbi:MAG: GtrA family protein [Bacilli bacterium]|nr:GtrA family protein [Bacilli bacterium]